MTATAAWRRQPLEHADALRGRASHSTSLSVLHFAFTHIAECPYFGTALDIPGSPITARLRVGSLAQDRVWLARMADRVCQLWQARHTPQTS